MTQFQHILVTGAEGFIGSHLVEALVAQGRRVRAMALYNSFGRYGWLDTLPPATRARVDLVMGDVRDAFSVREAMRGCDAVMHLAALIAIPYSYAAPSSYVDTNVTGTLHVVQAARDLGIGKVVHTSTSEVYGTAQVVPIPETHPLVGQSPYSASKIGADQMAHSYYCAFGTPVATARPFNTYGPRQSLRAVLPTIMLQALSDAPSLKLGALTPTRDFNFVTDTVAGLIAVLDSDKAVGEVINLGSGHEISIADSVRLIAEITGKALEVQTEDSRVRPPASEVERLVCDPAKAQALLGWRSAMADREGLKLGFTRSLEWFADPINRGHYQDVQRYVVEIIAAISSVVGDVPRPVALHEPLFAGNENAYVKSCIDEGWVSSVGAFVNRFEKDLAAFCGAPRAVVVVNGTCAIHAALMVMGVKPGDEVIIPALTFVATANAVVHAGAAPHFVDVEETSLGMDPQALLAHLERVASRQGGQTVNKLTGRPIRALMPVHIFGHPCRLEELAAVAREWNLVLVEDATEALGSTQDGQPVGSRHTAVFSFNGNKMVTTGGGGAVTTHDEELYQRLKHLTTTAKQSHEWAFLHDQVGYNYRMPNLNAALGVAQLEQAPRFLASKRALAAAYMRAFEGMKGVRILPTPPGTESNYWLVSLLAERAEEGWLDTTLQALHDAGLQCRPIWQPLHLLPMYREHPRGDLSRTESVARRLISLPSSVKLGLPFIGG